MSNVSVSPIIGKPTVPSAASTGAPPLPRRAILPGEFEFHEAVTIGCAQLIRNFPQVFVNIIRAIHRHIRVMCLVNAQDEVLGKILLTAANIPKEAVEFIRLPSVSMWARDWSPISGFDEEGKRRFLAFELRHLRTSAHSGILPELSRRFGSPILNVPLTHEGGNILSNGDGVCLTSTTIFLKNTERAYDTRRIAEILGEFFGIGQWAYLDSLSGEPTGHVDLFCVFLSKDLVVVGEYDPAVDAINASILDRAAEILSSIQTSSGPMRVARIPMPPAVDGHYRSYTNVLFANQALIVPLFPEIDDKLDRQAMAIYKGLLPDREIIGIDISELSSLGGGLHCLSSNIVPAHRGDKETTPENGTFQCVESAGMRTA